MVIAEKTQDGNRAYSSTYTVAMVGFLSTAAGYILDLVLQEQAMLTLPPYRDIIEEFGLTPESSDESIVQAIFSMSEHYSTRCDAGWVLAVTRNGKRIIVPGGVMEVGKANKPVTQDTLFEIGSVSKPFTGLVLAEKVVTGLVTLDTPLNDLLPDSIPDLIVNGELVTFRQLVTHSAGFPRDFPQEAFLPLILKGKGNLYKANPFGGYTEEDLLQEIKMAAGELSQSGESEYSNLGFSILAYLLGKIENTPFRDLQKALTDTLGLNNTWAGTLPDKARAHLSTGHRGFKQVPHWYDGGLRIDGQTTTLSSAQDLCRFVEILMSPNTIIDGEDGDLIDTLKLSLTRPGRPYGIAFAWGYYGGPSNRVYGHSGLTGGFATHVTFQPSSQTGIIGMTNCALGVYDNGAMHQALAAKLLSSGRGNSMDDLVDEAFQAFAPLN